MAIDTHRVTPFASSSSAHTHTVRQRPRSLASGVLGLALGCALWMPAALAQSQPTLSGNWRLACTGRGGQVRQISLQIGQQGTTLDGTFNTGHRSGKLSGSVQGNEVSLRLAGPYRTATLTGTADGNTLQVHGPKGAACTGTRQ